MVRSAGLQKDGGAILHKTQHHAQTTSHQVASSCSTNAARLLSNLHKSDCTDKKCHPRRCQATNETTVNAGVPQPTGGCNGGSQPLQHLLFHASPSSPTILKAPGLGTALLLQPLLLLLLHSLSLLCVAPAALNHYSSFCCRLPSSTTTLKAPGLGTALLQPLLPSVALLLLLLHSLSLLLHGPSLQHPPPWL
jgi:hypothetical protein